MPKSYTSSTAVQVDGRYYKAGEVFVTDKPKGETWTVVTKAEKSAIEASVPLAGDPPLEGLTRSALQAIAWLKRVNGVGLSASDLIDAIKAADEPKL